MDRQARRLQAQADTALQNLQEACPTWPYTPCTQHTPVLDPAKPASGFLCAVKAEFLPLRGEHGLCSVSRTLNADPKPYTQLRKPRGGSPIYKYTSN